MTRWASNSDSDSSAGGAWEIVANPFPRFILTQPSKSSGNLGPAQWFHWLPLRIITGPSEKWLCLHSVH